MPKIKIELDCLKELVKGESSEATETKLKDIETKDKEQDVRLTDVTNRVVVLENRTDNDNQTLALDGNTLSISNGNSVTLPNSASSAISAYSLNGEGSMVDPFIKGESSTLYPESSVGKLEGLFSDEDELYLRTKVTNGTTKYVSIPQNIPTQSNIDEVNSRLDTIESKQEAEYELVYNSDSKKLTLGIEEGDLIAIYGLNTDQRSLRSLMIKANVQAKIKSPFEGEEMPVNSYMVITTTPSVSARGGYKYSVGRKPFLYVEFLLFYDNLYAQLVYEPDINGEVSKYRKVLTLAELMGEIPARISITKDNVEIGYVEANINNLQLSENTYTLQKKV